MDKENASKNKPKKWKNGSHCCIPNCNNYHLKDIEENTYHSYYRFPPKDSKQLQLWLQNNRLRRGKNYQPKSWERICSSHFEGGMLLCIIANELNCHFKCIFEVLMALCAVKYVLILCCTFSVHVFLK